jgi:hypothetical protein
MHQGTGDGFDNYRRERERMRRLGNAGQRSLSGPANALQELEEVELREIRDRRLSLEMKDFFESATRMAADIVQKVASSAKVQIDSRLGQEMADFLRESITRVQSLVTEVLKNNTSSTAEQVIEPLMHNLVGTLLDEFRRAGTAGTNKHLGEDPMAQSLDAVRRDLLAQLPQEGAGSASLETKTRTNVLDAMSPPVAGLAPTHPDIEDHLVAEVRPEQGPRAVDGAADQDRFQRALDKLVKKGQMTKDEADAARNARRPQPR